MPKAQSLMLFAGLFLVIIGVGLVIYQMMIVDDAVDARAPSRRVGLEAAGVKANVQTTYVGLVLVVSGVFLMSIGYLGAKPWKKIEETESG